MSDCPQCFSIPCPVLNDLDFYSLDSPIFPYILICPPGQDCGPGGGGGGNGDNPGEFRILCCGQETVINFTTETIAQRTAAIGAAINACAIRKLSCGEIDCLGPQCAETKFYWNAQKTCVRFCVDEIQVINGVPTRVQDKPFFYTVYAGTILGDTQEEADKFAAELACVRATNLKFCVNVPAICPCKGAVSLFEAPIVGGTGPFTAFAVFGTVPTGMTISVTGRKVNISGTPTASGTFTFTLKVNDTHGGYWEDEIVAHVLEISTTSPTDFQVGVPYSFQLVATGGSGVYDWRISSGTLPAGLSMSLGGLITGTPLNDIATSFTVEMIDEKCQDVDKRFFTPIAGLAGHSTETIATVRGFSEYTNPSSPPKKYMKQTYVPLLTGNDASGLPVTTNEASSAYLYADHGILVPIIPLATWNIVATGVDEINAAGGIVSSATVQLYSSCPFGTFEPAMISPSDPPYRYLVKGWAFPFDQTAMGLPADAYVICATAANPPEPQANGSLLGFVGNGTVSLAPYNGRPHFTSPTHGENTTDGQNNLGIFFNPTFIPFPPNIGVPFLDGYSAIVKFKSNYTADISVEYTDALALANAQIIISNSLTATSFPRTTGFVSRWTAVTFHLHLSNLVFGEIYVAKVDLRDSDNVVTTLEWEFTATDDAETIIDTIPTPPNGKTITARNARVAYKVP